MIAHGGNISEIIRDHGGARADWLDLSTGISPFMAALPEMGEDVWRSLPDRDLLHAVEQKARQFYGTDLPCMCVPGSQYVIEKLPQIVPGPTTILAPTYGEYEHAYVQGGQDYLTIALIEKHDAARSLILANPNNPTGDYQKKSDLLALVKKLESSGKMLVVDEAFAGFQPNDSLLDAKDSASNLLIMRSFGKFFGLAGIRLGFVFAHAEVIEQLGEMSGPWAVSGPALAVADHLLSKPEYALELADRNKIRREAMRAGLISTGVKFKGSCPLFTLVESENASALYKHLLAHKIYVRRFDYNKTWLRIGLTRDIEEDARLVGAFQSFELDL